jgi:hypothetical protein
MKESMMMNVIFLLIEGCLYLKLEIDLRGLKDLNVG